MEITKVGVVGAGTMGASIAVALIGRGYPVVLKDVSEDAVRSGMARVDRLLESRVKKGLPESSAESMRSLLQPSADYSAFPDVDLVIEAVAENLDIKKKVFQDLDDCCNVHAILATNTSSLPVTRIASFTRRPDKVVGMHFFNPAHLMRLVEIIPGLDTAPATVREAIEFGQKLGKLAVRVEECPSFLVNRLLGRYMNESLWCLQEGNADIEQIDKAACDYVMPIGPLALRDMNGADIGLAVARYNFQEYGERFLPPPVLSQMVEQNLLGQKSGAGFYLYDKETKKRTTQNPAIREILDSLNLEKSNEPFAVERLFLPMINEAFIVLQEKVCDADDLDPALSAGLGMRKGPLTLAGEIGLPDCLRRMEDLFERHGERFRPAPLLKRYVWSGRKSLL